VGQARVARLQADYDVRVEWRTLEIHPEIPPEGLHWPRHLRERFGGMSDMLRQEAEKAGLPLVVPDIIPKSRQALEATEYAREQGKFDAFHELVWRRFYGEGQDLGNWEMLRGAAEEVGLDADEMQRKTESGVYSATIDAHLREVAALGGTGVPLFIFDQAFAVAGLQPYAAFQEVMEHIERVNGRGEGEPQE
jgi:predicted DsbA family dithiol-disulfide isomerase